MSEIEIRVVSNRDNLRCKTWPTSLTCRPMVGDYILAKDGIYSGKIIRITHLDIENYFDVGSYHSGLELYVDEC